LDPPNSISPDSDNDIVTEPLPVAQGKENEFSRTKYFIAGGIAGAVSRTATAPFDRMRVSFAFRI
jgi:solute carrier family 25 phosphate transporter 23/24/25/41